MSNWYMNSDEPKPMTEDDIAFSRLWATAKRAIGRDDMSYNASLALAKLLGIDYPEPRWWMHVERTPELINALRLLAYSPHRKTVLAIIKARKEV